MKTHPKNSHQVHHQQGEFEGEGGTSLFYQAWRPTSHDLSKDKPVLVLIHGMAEHSDRYQFPVHYFTEKDFTLYAMDLRGHGNSGGRKAYAESLDQLIDDIEIFLKLVVKKEKGKKIFLVGHSFGGQLVLNYGIRFSDQYPHPLSGIIVSSPNIRLRLQIPRIKLLLAPILSRWAPTLALANELDPSLVCRNNDVVEAYRTDKKVLKKITARLAHAILENQLKILTLVREFRVPCLLMHAGEDQICCPSGTKDFFKKIPIRDKKLIIYDELYHELFNEEEREKVFRDMEKWIEERI